MESRTIAVAATQAGKTVARVLHDHLGVSHATARGLVAAGRVRRNAAAVSRADERVAPGDRIELSWDPATRYREAGAPRRSGGYRIVHEDRDLVVVDKPPGLLTVPVPSGRGATLEELLVAAYRARGHRDPRALAVHRIDRYTSGLVAFARNAAAHARLREQFAEGRPERVYLAVAAGHVEAERGRLVHHLVEHEKSLKVRPAPPSRRARPAACEYRVLERFAHATLLEVRLETGRRNQIRVQLAAEGHPLLGDRAYGLPTPLIARTALHAARLCLEHPRTGARLALVSPAPEDFRRLLRALRRGASPAPGPRPGSVEPEE